MGTSSRSPSLHPPSPLKVTNEVPQLEYSIYIGTIAATLLNFGAKPTKISFLAAGAFSVVAIISLLYSVGIYLYRAKAIRERKAIKYHDKYGPTVLCFCLFTAVIINGAFELSDRGFI
jgi:hypothetical protein